MASETKINIKAKLTKKDKDNQEQIEFFKERIIVLDNEKTDYDAAITNIDTLLYNQVENVNSKLRDVRTTYQNRHTAGCRTDLFWRRVGFSSIGGFFSDTYVCTKTSIVGYSSVGFGTDSVTYITDSSGSETTVSKNTLIGYDTHNLHGIKYYDEPYAKDATDSFVTGFIGTVGAGSSQVTVMALSSSGVMEPIKIGQLLVCDKPGVFGVSNNEIVGFGTTTVDLTPVGIASTTATVNTIIVEFPASAAVSAPESDGSLIQFKILKSAEELGNIGVPMSQNPYVAQSIGIMNSSNIGIGVSVYYDNSGISTTTQSWNQFLDGVTGISEPKVGAGKIYYNTGFTVKPAVYSGGVFDHWAVEGETAVNTYPWPSGSGVVNVRAVNLSTCPTQETALTNAISIATAAENELTVGITTFENRLSATTAIRKIRNEQNLQIWGHRQVIYQMQQDQDYYNSLKTSLDDPDISSIID
jgi:hypothetical protein